MIYITSDTHFCHDKSFLYAPRGFASVEEMNEQIVKNWNSLVRFDDDVYLLGDVMLNDNNEGLRLLKSLNGKIHIIRGNHDSDARIELYKSCFNVVSVSMVELLKVGGLHFYLSHYPTLTSNFDFDKPLKSRVFNLCGHTHTSDPFLDWDRHNSPIYHCELDAHNNFPVSTTEIITDILHKTATEQ